MKIIFLGTGSSFTIGDGNFQSNILFQGECQERLLIDCGSDIRHSLAEHQQGAQHISDVYISHLHSDHIGGMEWLALSSYFLMNPPKRPRLYINQELIRPLWEHALSAGLSTLEDFQTTIDTFFEVKAITNELFKWGGISFKLIPAVHVISNNEAMPCYGLFFAINGRKIFITADTRFVPNLHMPYYLEADLIFHDCETYSFRSGVHAHFEELVGLRPEIKSKMWLYHYAPGELPDAEAEGFCGFVKKGQIFEF